MGTYLGQNFLTDNKIRHYLSEKIKKFYNESWCEVLIEIWPGKWSLTKLIHHISPNFFVIEKDGRLVDTWTLKVEWLENVEVILWDVLEVDVNKELEKRSKISQKTLVVGNLPYYITSPILRKFFGEGQQDYAGGIFMVQKEVADKLCSDAQKKSYLWWILNFAYDVSYLKTVPAKAFSPAPKVSSALIKLKIKNEKLTISFEKLLEFLDNFSPYSRKTLGAISTMIKKKKNKSWHIPEDLKKKRLEELWWKDIEKCL